MRPDPLSCRFRVLAAALVLFLTFLGGCSGGGSSDGVTPDPAVAFLAGDWSATRFQVTNDADPSSSHDLVSEVGARFTLDVQPSGQYTAILTFQGIANTEIGQLQVRGDEITFQVQTPCCSSNTATVETTSDGIRLHGATEYDFNSDGIREPATADIDLVKE